MRKALVLLAILAFTMAGCCPDPTGVSTSKSFTNCMDTVVDWFCANRATIEQQVANAQATINSINSIYGSQIPAAEQTLINDAQQVIAAGQAALAAATCPTTASLVEVNLAVGKLYVDKGTVNASRIGKAKMIP